MINGINNNGGSMYPNNLSLLLFEEIKRFNKTAAKNEKIFKTLNMNDLIVCGKLLRNEEENRLTQVKDLSDYMNISRPAVNTILNRLEDRGIIERVRLKEDRKSVYVKLTEKAYALYEVEKLKVSKVMDKIVLSLGETEANKLVELLEKVNNILEEEVS